MCIRDSRIELRLADGSANPYLLFASVLACGLHGIDNTLDPGAPNTANLFALSSDEVAERGLQALPPTLIHASENLATNAVLEAGLGTTGDGPYSHYFASVKRDEFLRHHAEVTPGEIRRYLTLF